MSPEFPQEWLKPYIEWRFPGMDLMCVDFDAVARELERVMGLLQALDERAFPDDLLIVR